MKKFGLIGLFLLVFAGTACAQGPQCRTSPTGASTPSCASEAFVTKSIAAAPQGTVTSVGTAGLATGGPITLTGTVTVTAASKSDQQTGTSTTLAVTPSQQQSHDSAAKAWVYFTVGGSPSFTVTIQASYNITSVVRASAGVFNITFTTAFASANYAASAIAESHTINTGITSDQTLRTASVFQLDTLNAVTGGPADPAAASAIFFGRQ